MVGMGIFPNNIRPPLPNVTRYSGMMTIYSDTLHWSDITPIFDRFWSGPYYRIWLLPNCARFQRTFATGAACQQRTLTAPDTWSCPTMGLACILMSRQISPQLVLFPDFWVSNIPRYFYFALLIIYLPMRVKKT